VRDRAGGAFLGQQRNAVLIGGTGTGKTHLAIAIARSSGSRGRFYNVVDLVNRLESMGKRVEAISLSELPSAPSGTA
jgi:DNA replication protein DnaC